MSLSDAIVYNTFIEFIDQHKKEKRVRCRYCQRDSTKYISRQRDHLTKCKAYLSAIKEQQRINSVTRKVAGLKDDT